MDPLLTPTKTISVKNWNRAQMRTNQNKYFGETNTMYVLFIPIYSFYASI